MLVNKYRSNKVLLSNSSRKANGTKKYFPAGASGSKSRAQARERELQKSDMKNRYANAERDNEAGNNIYTDASSVDSTIDAHLNATETSLLDNDPN
jgi:hypothetical protein